VLENQGGSFTKKTTSNLPITETGCAWWPHPVLGDWNADARRDVYMGSQRLHIFGNDGTNKFTFVTAVEQEKDPNFFGDPPGSADLNGDGLVDVVGPRTIFFGDGTPPHLPAPFPGNIAQSLNLDWEGDGDGDLLMNGGAMAVNDATGHYTQTGILFPPPPSEGFFAAPSAVADFDGDGRADILIPVFKGFPPVFQGMRLLTDHGVGRYDDGGKVLDTLLFGYEDGMPRRGADIDGDGDQDLPYHNGFWINDGTGHFAFQSFFPATDIAEVADVDGDGDADVLPLLDSGSTAKYFLQRNQGNLQFTQELLVSTGSGNLGFHARFLDLDDDGDLDVAVPASTGSIAVYVFENQNGALLTAPNVIGGIGETTVVAIDDVDGDGRSDLLCDRVHIRDFNANALQVHRRLPGPGLSYEAHRDWMVDPIQAFVDVDQDGDLDGFGTQLARSRRFTPGPDDGMIRQFGQGGAGAGGAVPVLGASGPLRPGSSTASLRIERALGGTTAYLLVGLNQANIPGFGGTSLYVAPPFVILSFHLSGAPGVPGDGGIELPIVMFPGLKVYAQAAAIDASTIFGFVATGGLELTFGF
jgi:FG-GAP-like repeat